MLRLPLVLAGLTLLVALANVAVLHTASAEWLADYRFGFMAVTTATAFALLGGSLLLRLAFAEMRWAQTTIWVVAVFVAGAGLHTFIGRTTGQSPAWEAWLDSGIPVKIPFQMLRTTTVLLMLSAFSLWALTRRESRLPWMKEVGVVAAGVLALLGFLSLVSSTAGNPVFSRTEPLNVSMLTALDLCFFNCALLLSVSHTGRLRRLIFGVYEVEDLPPLLRNDRMAFGVLGLAAVVLVSGLGFYLRLETGQIQRRVGAELQVAAELKTDQLTAWRQERMGDARALVGNPDLPRILESLRSGQAGPERRAELGRWLASFARIYDYERVVLLDATLTPVLAGSAGITPAASLLEAQLRAAAGNAEVLMLEPTADAAGELCLEFLAPLPRPAGLAPIGAVLLQSKPSRSILSMLQVWPYGNQTGQFVLWRRVGQRLYSLGGYRLQAGLADAERRPFNQVRELDDPNLLIARVAAGETGILEGTDVRGIPIIGLGRRIPDTDWLLTCRIDASEVYAPLRRSAWQIVGATMLVFGGVGFFITRRLRHRQLDLFRERIVAELAQKRTAARLGAVMAHARDVIFILDADLNIVEANQCAIDTYGWSLEEFQRMNMRDLRSAASLANYPQTVAQIREKGAAAFESEHRRKDGSVFPIEVRTSLVDIDGRKHFFPIIRDITERKRTDAKLRASEERYRLIAENTSDIIWLTDLRSGVFTYVSPAIEPILGWRPDEAIGQRVGDFVRLADEMRTSIQARVAAFNAGDMTQRHQRYELELRHRDGSFRTAESSSSILPDADGQAAMLLTASRDISERRQAEAALRESEERYRLIAENTSDVIWLYDLSTDAFSYVSAAALPVLGYRPEELLGANLNTTLTAESGVVAAQALRRMIAEMETQGQPQHTVVELEQRHKDGRIIPTDVTSSLLPGRAGRPTLLLGITRDITERRRAQQVLERFNAELEQKVELRTAELAANQKLLRTLVDNLQSVIYMKDRSGRYLLVNPYYTKVTGIAAEAIFGKTDLDVMAPEVAGPIMDQDRHVMESGESRINEEVVPRPDGATTHYLSTKVPLFDEQGRIYGMCGISSDITALKQVERDVLANLEREKQLSEMKSQFISVASHEFRTPLAAAVGSLELLERHAAKLTEAKRVELLNRIQRSLGRLTTIMNDVLQLSRADSGRVQVKRMDVDLGRFVQDIIHEVQAGDGEKHRFEFHRTGGPDVVPVDTNLVNHILSNLVGNAVRYSPAGTTITVHLEITPEAFTLRIVDQGIGIPEADRDRIFEPFARGSNVGQISGTGLGLNIVKRYVELMGGRIQLLPGDRGTTFLVEVPVAQRPS